MRDDALPEGWEWPDAREAAVLTVRFRHELDPTDPAAARALQVVAREKGGDAVLAAEPGGAPPYYLLHLSWDDAPPRAAHSVERLADLAAITSSDPRAVDYVSGWTEAETETGFVLVQHLVRGGEVMLPLDWPHAAVPLSTAALVAMGWRPVTGALVPRARVGDHLLPSGQTVEYWVRPVADDFMLFRAIHTPGEPIVLQKLMPAHPRLLEFDNVTALEAALPADFYTRLISPQTIGWGRRASRR